MAMGLEDNGNLCNRPQRILVVGAGVIGLTTALHLQSQGHEVAVWAEKFTPHTTSDGAAAVWEPYHVEPDHKVLPWASRSLTVFKSQKLDSESGVFEISASHKWRKPTATPFWAEAVENFRLSVDRTGFSYTTYVADMSIYMPWLKEKFFSNGGQIKTCTVASFKDSAENFDIVVNCAGLGNVNILSDDQTFPIRGVIVEMGPRVIEEVRIDHENPKGVAYVIPRLNSVICGGCAIENDWNLEEYPGEAEGIISRCTELAPELKKAQKIKVWVGHRPARSQVRLESEFFQDGKLLIHNYGHGGAGVTLAWGCAEEVGEIVSGFVGMQGPHDFI